MDHAEAAWKKAEDAMMDQLEDKDPEPVIHMVTYPIGSMPWTDLAEMRKNDPWVWKLEQLKNEADQKILGIGCSNICQH